jgi:hypothetical protein
MSDESQDKDLRPDPEDRSFPQSRSPRLDAGRSELPCTLLVIVLLIGLYASCSFVFQASSWFLDREISGALLCLMAGLLSGYRAGFRAGRRQEQEDSKPLPPVPDRIVQLAREEGLIAAIKVYREETGVGLRRAKLALDTRLEGDFTGRSDH